MTPTNAQTMRRYSAMRLPKLPYEQERELIFRAQRGDKAATDKLVRATLGFVLVFVAKRNLGRLSLEDAIQEGQLGILKALEKFDLSSRVLFATYATWWIRAFVERAIQSNSSVVRPRLGHSHSITDWSLNEAAGDEKHAQTWEDLLVDESLAPDDRVANADRDAKVRHVVLKALQNKRPLLLDIVVSRLCEGSDRESLDTIGARYGMTRERVRQLELKAKALLAMTLRDAGLDDREAA